MQALRFNSRGNSLRIANYPWRSRAVLTWTIGCLLFASIHSSRAATAVNGPGTVCVGTTNSYTVTTDSLSGIYVWTFGTSNTAGAVILGDSTNSSVSVTTATNGGFTIECQVDPDGSNEVASANVIVPGLVAGTPLTSLTECPGGTVTFTTTVTGDAPYSIVWRKGGDVIAGATNNTLAFTNIDETAAGSYCVEVAGSCNSFTNCATLEIVPLATLAGPTNLLLQCLSEVPAPDTNSITATNAVAVFFVGDLAVTNNCEITITRTYAAVNSCGATSTCAQVIGVMDTLAPVFSGVSNLVATLGNAWNFEPPTVNDNCAGTNVALFISGTTTNALCGNAYAVSRVWTAMDACSNVATFSQTVAVVDTTPPVIMCPTNFTVECDTPWSFSTPVAADKTTGNALVYDNTVNDLAFRLDLAGREAGNEIMLAGQSRYLQGFSYEFWSTNLTGSPLYEGTNVTVQLRFYANDGPDFNGYPTPGTLLYASGEFGLGAYTTPRATVIYDEYDLALYAAYPLMVEMPSNFTWTVQFSGLGSNDLAGVDLYSPPVIGAAYDDFWLRTGTGWELRTNAGAAAPMAAQAWANTNQVAITVLSTVTNVITSNDYEVTRTWRATDVCGNYSDCSQTVTVRDTVAPVLTGLTNKSVEWPEAWTFDMPAATDNCAGTNVTLVISDTTTNALCGNTYAAVRTWRATDPSSNAATLTQTVTVVDTTPPAFTGLTNIIVEYGTNWSFETPAVTDIADGTNVLLVVSSTVTNPLCGATFAATRTWVATDSCSNSATFAQLVTVMDTTKPDIYCSSNIVVECIGGLGNPVDFTVTALDVCDTNVTVVANPPSGSLFSLGTNTVQCTAWDDCGNTNECSFLVIVEDTTPPQLVTPSNMIVSEAPRDSGGAVVTFAPPTVLDTCDSAPQMTSSPVSGSVFPVGTNTVTWTAVDGSGNSNSCTFTVRVIPYRLFVVSNTDDSGVGSLRQAILDSNDAPDDNLIIFSLTGSGPFNIDLLSPLPLVTGAVIIDGWTQGGSNMAPVVELRGSSNAFDGLVIQSGRSTVRGLSFHGFATAILLGGGTNVVQGNSIGVDSTGAFAFGNEFDGIYVNSPGNQIGGTTSGTGNLISGNSRNGITLATPDANNNQIQGNIIGAGVTGTNALPNAGRGIFLTNGAALNLIGGTDGNSGNIIAFNGAAGVALDVSAGAGNSILGNSISGNFGLGIDLGGGGVTANDSDDSDSGPNGLQNYPVLSDARSAAGITVIDGSLSSTPNTSYRIEFFLNDTADPAGYGEGLRYLGATAVETKGNGSGDFSFSLPLTAVFTQFITATATDPEGNTSEFSPVVQVRTPPVIDEQPVSTNSEPGQPITFCAHATGTPPIQYQWRHNGVNISGATNPCYTILDPSIGDGGTYSVIIGNELGAFATASASLILGGTNILTLPTSDNFADAVDISGYGNGTNGILAGNNLYATLEPFEPPHAGKTGGRSVWYRWCTPPGNKGIATFRTLGSTFDTVMAVYRGSSVSNLFEEASDEDTGRFYSSEVRFNAFYNDSPLLSCYYIAIDGRGGAGGPFVLQWEEEKTSHMLPVILTHPLSQTVAPGSSVTFSNFSVPECAAGHLDCNPTNHWEPNNWKKEKLTYQWYFEEMLGETLVETPIPGATNATYTIPSVGDPHLGDYHVRVFTPWQYLDSRKATLQINYNGEESQSVQAVDKFIDALFANVWRVGPPPSAPFAPAASGPMVMAAGVVRGYTGTQIFNTAGSATEPGEVICGVTGGSSEWITLVAEQSGTLFLNTDGSSYDTVMAVFRRNPTNAAALEQLNCDNNGGIDGKDSSVAVNVQMGSTNYVVVDGVNGVTGTLYLNYSLATTTIMKVAGKTAEGANIVQVNGRPGLNFKLQVSSDMKIWNTLVTTNAPTGIFDYSDFNGIGQPRRFYRALILP